MKSQEAVIRIVSKLDKMYPSSFDLARVRQAVESILYDYDVNTKITALAVLDNMEDRILMYLATKKIDGLSKKTIEAYGRHLGRFARTMRKNAEDITTMDIRIFLANYSKTGIKNSTLASETDILRVFFKWLEDEEYISKSPMRKIRTPKTEKRVREALTKEEFEILRGGALTLRQKALLEFFYSTACRLEEVENIKKKDIDWQRLSLKVIGKGNKERTVYISATAQVHIRKYIMSRLDDSDSLFVTERKPIKKMGRRAIQREMDKISEQSELDMNVYCHLIRHTAATHWLGSGMDITTVQSILGHDNLDTTQIYAQVSNVAVEHEFRKYS